MHCVILSRRAEQDLVAITDYISANHPQAASRVLDAIQESLLAIARHPHMGSLRDDLLTGLRIFPAKAPAKSYVILFRPCNEGIEVVTILHGARDWEGMFNRGEL